MDKLFFSGKRSVPKGITRSCGDGDDIGGADRGIGGPGTDMLLGRSGNDTMRGPDGNDVIRGETGLPRVSIAFGLRGGNGDSSKSYSRKCSTTLLNVGLALSFLGMCAPPHCAM